MEEAIFLIDRDGSDEREIACRRPDRSPDGKKLVFSLWAIEIALKIVYHRSIKPRTDVVIRLGFLGTSAIARPNRIR